MLTVILTRILILFLIIYSVNVLYQKYLKGSAGPKGKNGPAKREYTDYDRDEWEKIKKSLED